MSENKSVDRRTLKTQRAIRYALAELLQKKELRKITVQEIVDKAEISRVTFYKYYLDIYDLYDKLENEMLLNMGLIVLQLADKTTDEFFKELISYIYDNRVIFGMIFSQNVTGRLKDKLSRLIEGTFQKIYSEKLDIAIDDKELVYVCCYRSNGFLAIIQRWVQNDCKEPCESLIEPICELDRNIEQYFSNRKSDLRTDRKK